MTTISVALATFNGEAFLEDQLFSIANQSRLPDQLVVCDDGSTDNTLLILEQFAKRGLFDVAVYRNSNRLGYRKNFLQAAFLSSGDLIAFCDQDDVWRKDKLEICEIALSKPQILLCYHSAVVIDEAGKALGRHDPFPRTAAPEFNFWGMPHEWFSSSGFTQVFKRELLAFNDLHSATVDHNSPEESLAHDQWFFFIATILGKIRYICEDLAKYRQHGSNVDGWAGKRSKIRRALGITPKFDGYRAHAEAARSRAEVALQIENRILPKNFMEEPPVSMAYQELTTYYQRRAEIYMSKRSLERFAGVLALFARGAYSSFPEGGLGKLALLRDLAISVPFAERSWKK